MAIIRPPLVPAIGAISIVSTSHVNAQDALQNLIALDTARDVRREQVASPNYTFKSGDFRLLLTPSLGLDWNDNINTSSTSQQSDFILKPFLRLDMTYPLTQVNLLTLNLGVGYDYYFDHHDNNAWRVQSGSALSFDIFVDDFVINLHNRISYSRDSSQEPAVANTSDFGNRFSTMAGTFPGFTGMPMPKGEWQPGFAREAIVGHPLQKAD